MSDAHDVLAGLDPNRLALLDRLAGVELGERARVVCRNGVEFAGQVDRVAGRATPGLVLGVVSDAGEHFAVDLDDLAAVELLGKPQVPWSTEPAEPTFRARLGDLPVVEVRRDLPAASVTPVDEVPDEVLAAARDAFDGATLGYGSGDRVDDLLLAIARLAGARERARARVDVHELLAAVDGVLELAPAVAIVRLIQAAADLDDVPTRVRPDDASALARHAGFPVDPAGPTH